MRIPKTNQPRGRVEGRAVRSSAKMQTTLRLPRGLYEKIKLLATRRNAGSMNDFILDALASYVRAMERKAIDDSFLGMASDKDYQRETRRIMQEFAHSDAETLPLADRYLAGK